MYLYIPLLMLDHQTWCDKPEISLGVLPSVPVLPFLSPPFLPFLISFPRLEVPPQIHLKFFQKLALPARGRTIFAATMFPGL